MITTYKTRKLLQSRLVRLNEGINALERDLHTQSAAGPPIWRDVIDQLRAGYEVLREEMEDLGSTTENVFHFSTLLSNVDENYRNLETCLSEARHFFDSREAGNSAPQEPKEGISAA